MIRVSGWAFSLLALTAALSAAAQDHGEVRKNSSGDVVIEQGSDSHQGAGIKPSTSLSDEDFISIFSKARNDFLQNLPAEQNVGSPTLANADQQASREAAGVLTDTIKAFERGEVGTEQKKVVSSILGASSLEIKGDKVIASDGGLLSTKKSEKVVLGEDQKNLIAKTDSRNAAAITAAFVTKTMLVSAPDEDARGVAPQPAEEQAFADTQSQVNAAAGLGASASPSAASSSSSGASSSKSAKSDGHFNPEAMQFSNLARGALSLPSKSSSVDLSSNPLYSKSGSPEIQSALRDLAFSDMAGASPRTPADRGKKLMKLATSRGFQDALVSSLGRGAQKDFNLLTAGAVISSNPALPASGVAVAKAFIYNNIGASKMIGSSALLSQLETSLGEGGGLAGLSPTTLNWIALAGDLAFADPSKIPPDFASQQETYRKGFEELRTWMSTLKDADGLALLDELRAPADPEQARLGWEDAKRKFIEAHHKAKTGISAHRKSGDDGKRVVRQLDKLSVWAGTLADFDVGSVAIWGRATAGRLRFPVMWNRFDPLSLTQARFYYGRLAFYGTLPRFYSGSSRPIAALVADAQKWAARITDERKMMRNELASQVRAPGTTPQKPAAYVKEN